METQDTNTNLDQNKFAIFYKKYKSKILVLLFIIPIILCCLIGYNFYKEKKNVSISEKFNNANILLNKDQKDKSREIFVSLIDENHLFYSPLSLNLIVENNLIKDKTTLSKLFDKILNIKSLDKETRNLYRFKKATILSNYADENEILTTLNPIINSESIWKANALKFLEIYFLQKGDFNKSKEYQILLKKL